MSKATRRKRYGHLRAFLRWCRSEKLLRKNPIEKTISFHSLRYGFCTRLAEAGKPLQVIKEAARHSDVSTSMIYVHMANEHLKAELDDVFE